MRWCLKGMKGCLVGFDDWLIMCTEVAQEVGSWGLDLWVIWLEPV